jgi:hypothetical protein
MGQQKREEYHEVLKKRRKTTISPMREVGGAEKTMLIFYRRVRPFCKRCN